MNAQQIREAYIDYFASKNHKIVNSSSLLPQDDPTLLFTNAGMNQFKNVFLGLEKRSYSRATSVQKCMRVSGKHNDLEQVGRTSKHHTFFEMLGNFSFGDYFKRDAIEFAWELITQIYRLSPDRLYFTVYEEDDEAYDLWLRHIGVEKKRLFRMGKADNYWSMGDTGPCGPCSEIHYDMDNGEWEGNPKALIETGSESFVELWNLVFMQFNQNEQGEIHPLPSPSVDTGMGLERMAMVLQGHRTNYDTDLFLPIIHALTGICDCEYPSDQTTDVPVRIIADHIRAVVFLLSDGIMPANDGRGYVLRRLLRRAFRAGDKLGLNEPFLYKLVGSVGDIMKDAYPEILASIEYIAKICRSEEQRFASTLYSGMKTFQRYISEARKRNLEHLSGQGVFRLYDTYGFPLDLSRELAEEEGMTIDEAGFKEELEKQRKRARRAWKGDALQSERKVYETLKNLKTQFSGYDREFESEAEVSAIIREGQIVSSLSEGEHGEIFLSVTPFYAEAGGQVGDRGVLKNSHFSAMVEAVYFPIPDLVAHKVKILSGSVKTDDQVDASIDIPERRAISKNHTATHLLHASLRQLLGDHIKQAGSLVSPRRLRFDFTHFTSLSPAEISGLEVLINEKIQSDIELKTSLMSLEEGLNSGATAIFEEKYRENVRVVSINSFSRELCGGVHVRRTGEIGFFKIISESSIAAGMRRIEAVTGPSAILYVQKEEELLDEILLTLNSNRNEIILQLERLKGELKEKEKESRALRQKMADLRYQKPEEEIRKIHDVSILTQKVEGMDQTELRELADRLKQKLGSGVVILGGAIDQKVSLIITVSKDLTDRLKANDLIRKIAPLLGGGGGGRPDFAQAGGTKPERLDKVLDQCGDILASFLESP